MNGSIDPLRIRRLNDAAVRVPAEHVLYWMTSSRRTSFNFALERAADWARELGLPLVVLEAVRTDYPWASDRLHRFIIEGMRCNQQEFSRRNVDYLPYVEPSPGAGRGLLEALAGDAAVVVTDHFPTFFLPRMARAAARRLPVPVEAVDSNGLIPLAATSSEFATAHAFRRWLQRNLAGHLTSLPLQDPLAEALPTGRGIPMAVRRRWPAATEELLAGGRSALAALPIDHDVAPTQTCGGPAAARRRLRRFVDGELDHYAEKRNRPDDDRSSGLSPYLHFGHLSAHEVFLEVVRRERWSPDDIVPPADGRRAGWWGLSEPAEAFLDQLVTWRELGYVFSHHRPDHDRWESLPPWARDTLELHAADPREHVYSLDDFAAARTHDPLWNAAQRQLRREGTIHNYLRMLWGKKILEWTAHPREALEVMTELNNRFALDGRDPNSVSGIFWVLGRHDRAWGPERPIFGKIRYMSSANTARKVPVKDYLERFGPEHGQS